MVALRNADYIHSHGMHLQFKLVRRVRDLIDLSHRDVPLSVVQLVVAVVRQENLLRLSGEACGRGPRRAEGGSC
jgi:hypothetical protein